MFSKKRKIPLLFLILSISIFSLISCFGPSIVKSDINAQLDFKVDNQNYTWNTEKGTFKYPLLLKITNLNSFDVEISEFDIAILDDKGEELFSDKVTDNETLKSLFKSLIIPAKKELSITLYYTVPYRLLKKQFLINLFLQKGDFKKSLTAKFNYVDNYFPSASISIGPIKFYQNGFLDWEKDSQVMEIYAYLFESYLLSSLEYLGVFEPGNGSKSWNLNLVKYNKEKYYFVFHNKITNKDGFLNGKYTFEAKFKEGTIVQASQNVSFGNSSNMGFPKFPSVEYDDINFTLNVSNFAFKNNEIQFYKKTKDGFDFIAYYIVKDEGELYIDDILSDLKYLKGKSEDDLIGTIYVNACSYTHSDEQLTSLKDKDWVNVYYVYSKSIEVEF